MRQIISFLLAFLMSLLPSASGIGAAGGQDETLRVATSADWHYVKTADSISGDFDDDLYFYTNKNGAMKNETDALIDAFLANVAGSDVEYVFVSGDLVDEGSIIEDHEHVSEKLKAFEERTGKQVFVICGNHDIRGAMTVDKFKDTYADLGYNEALTVSSSDCSYTANLGETYRLIAVDTCSRTKASEDGFTTDRLLWVKQQAAAAKADGRYPVVIMHHNLIDHIPLQRIISRHFIIRWHYTAANLFANWGIKYVFTGHEHCSDGTSLTSTLGNKIYDFATSALTMYPISYRDITFTDSKVTMKQVYINSLDTSGLKGYTDEQLELLHNDLNAYAKGFFAAGMKLRLEGTLSPEKIGLDDTSPFFDLIDLTLKDLKDILEMPLYSSEGNTNSLEALGAKYSIELPESDYATAWDCLTELIIAHYAGSENFSLDSAEITLFFDTLNIGLRSLYVDVNDELILKQANELFGEYGTEGIADKLMQAQTSLFGSVSPTEYLAAAMLAPLIQGFMLDDDGVPDNDGVFDGYGESNQNAFFGLFTRLFN